MKKYLLFAAASLASILLLAGCGGGGSSAAEAGASAQQAAEADSKDSNNPGGSLATDDENSTDVDKQPQRSTRSTVFFTSDISAEGLVRIYEALGWTPSGKLRSKYRPANRPQAITCGRN